MEAIFDMASVEGAPARELEVLGGLGLPSPADLTWVVAVASLCMLFMAWGIGANDVANSFATAFGAKCLTPRQACCIAAVCELLGCLLLGGNVSDTIRKGMMSVELYEGDEGRVLVMAGMTSVLLAAASWLLVASKYGLPVSTTHSAVGGVVAFAVASKGYRSVTWSKVLFIVASWFISPTMSGVVGFCTYLLVRRLVLEREDSLRRAKLASPLLVFVMTMTVSMFTIYKGAKGLGLAETFSPIEAVGVSVAASLLVAGLSYPLMVWHAKALEALETQESEAVDSEMGSEESAQQVQVDVPSDRSAAKQADEPAATATKQQTDPRTEQMFRGLVVVIAAFQSVAHGANDVANSVGPFAAVLAAKEGPLEEKTHIPIWVFALAGAFIVVGLVMWGLRVMQTVGKDLTEVTPSKACCAQFSATLVVLLATRLGIPISTTHAAVGGVLGVGMSEGVKAIDWKVMAKVFLSWIITLPICALTAAGTYALFLPLLAV